MKYAVTLKQLREAGACYAGYNKLVRALQNKPFTEQDEDKETYIRFAHKEAIPVLFIAESNGFDNALWSMKCVKNADRDLRLFAVWCARQVQHLMTDQRSINTLDVAERFANGSETIEELATAMAAAWDAAMAAAWDAAMAAARDAQKQMFIAMCNNAAPWQKGA